MGKEEAIQTRTTCKWLKCLTPTHVSEHLVPASGTILEKWEPLGGEISLEEVVTREQAWTF